MDIKEYQVYPNIFLGKFQIFICLKSILFSSPQYQHLLEKEISLFIFGRICGQTISFWDLLTFTCSSIVNTEYLIYLIILLRVSRLPTLGRMMIVCCELASSTIINIKVQRCHKMCLIILFLIEISRAIRTRIARIKFLTAGTGCQKTICIVNYHQWTWT